VVINYTENGAEKSQEEDMSAALFWAAAKKRRRQPPLKTKTADFENPAYALCASADKPAVRLERLVAPPVRPSNLL
jgi:hypothetical protein